MAYSEEVIFNGITFRRYPNSSVRSHRVYFRPSSYYIRRGIGHLHQEIWKHHNGPIPKGHDIHHADENPLNNSKENLVCLTKSEHRKAHKPSQAALDHLAEIRPLAVKWHGTRVGRRFHKRLNVLGLAAQRNNRSFRPCKKCSKSFWADTRSKFCSNNCKSQWRRKQRLDFIERRCRICREVFSCNRYSRQQTCSRKCGSRLTLETKAAK